MRMKKRFLYGIALLCALVLLISMFMTGTYAWQGKQQVLNTAYGEQAAKMPVELIKLEKQANGTKTEKPVSGAVFYLYRENGQQIDGRYITDEDGKINVQLSSGEYYFEEVSPAIGYTYDTDEKGEEITKYEFTVTEQEKTITVEAYNKRLEGALLISKKVENSDGSSLSEVQKQIRFDFTVEFSDGGTYEYRIDNGEAQYLTSGDTLQLCSGETAAFANLPAGILYDIKETRKDGYTVSSTGDRGNIVADQVAEANFVNIWRKVPESDNAKLNIQKKLAGNVIDSDKEREYQMTLTVDGKLTKFYLKAGETKTFEVPKGAVYEVKEDDYMNVGLSQSVTNGSGTVTEDVTDVVITNTRMGEAMVEINGEKTWDFNGCDVELPESITVKLFDGDKLIEEQQVTAGEDELWKYSFVAPKYGEDGEEIEYTVEERNVEGFNVSYDGYDITNTYIKPALLDPPIITKIVKGEDAPSTAFEFVLTGQNGAPMPEGSDGQEKTLMLTGEGELELGVISYDKEGTYVYTVHEKNGGVKGWAYDTAVYTITVTVTEKDNALVGETSIVKNDKKVKKIVFTNTFDSGDDEMIIISGVKTWEHGNNPESKRPTEIIVEVYADGKLSAQRRVTEKDNWCYSFIKPRYDEDGHELVYSVNEKKVDGYNTKVNGYDITNTYIGNNPVQVGPDKPDSPDTGDYSNLKLWFALMIISLAGAIVSIRGTRCFVRK